MHVLHYLIEPTLSGSIFSRGRTSQIRSSARTDDVRAGAEYRLQNIYSRSVQLLQTRPQGLDLRRELSGCWEDLEKTADFILATRLLHEQELERRRRRRAFSARPINNFTLLSLFPCYLYQIAVELVCLVCVYFNVGLCPGLFFFLLSVIGKSSRHLSQPTPWWPRRKIFIYDKVTSYNDLVGVLNWTK